MFGQAMVEALTPGAVMPGTFLGQTFAEGNSFGKMDGASPSMQPTKLFIGGISRRTTTKQLREHFSKCGCVLDCVAMRTPDGRPRGFGYVTLDSPGAAERFLSEPQMIDDRIVDLKRAVPESQTSKAGAAAGYPEHSMASMQAAYSQQNMFYSWPENSGFYYDNGYGNLGMPDMGLPLAVDPAADCVDLLTGMLGFQENLMEYQDPLLLPQMQSVMTKPSKVPLGEVTNFMSNAPLLDSAKKPFQASSKPFEPAHIDIGALSPMGPTIGSCFVYEDSKDCEQASAPSTEPPSPAQAELSPLAPSCATPATPEDLSEGLPSLGSAQHASGECRRCNFFAKGRCRSGVDCVFCHFSHERRKLSRQEKREQQAARLARGEDGGDSGSEEGDTASPKSCGPLLSPDAARAPPGLLLGPAADEQVSESAAPPVLATGTVTGPAPPPGLQPPAGLLQPRNSRAAPPAPLSWGGGSGGGGLLSTTPSSSTGGPSPVFLLSTTPSAKETLLKNVVKETRSVETQTDDDFTCPCCEVCDDKCPTAFPHYECSVHA